MDLNEGKIDRALRIAVGLALIAFLLGLFGIDHAYAWGRIGLVPLITGLVGWCPLYSLLHVKTGLAAS
jgi:hypothetical protein